MYPIPYESMSGAFEMICYFGTFLSALFGYFLSIR